MDEDEDYDDLEEDDNPEQYTLAHSQLAVTPFLHRSYNGNKLYEVIQYDFNPDSSSLPRGLEKLPFGEPCEINDAFIESRGGWTVYDRPIWKSTFSTPVWPLFPGDPCASILNWWPKKKTEKEKNPGRGDEMTLTVTGESRSLMSMARKHASSSLTLPVMRTFSGGRSRPRLDPQRDALGPTRDLLS